MESSKSAAAHTLWPLVPMSRALSTQPSTGTSCRASASPHPSAASWAAFKANTVSFFSSWCRQPPPEAAVFVVFCVFNLPSHICRCPETILMTLRLSSLALKQHFKTFTWLFSPSVVSSEPVSPDTGEAKSNICSCGVRAADNARTHFHNCKSHFYEKAQMW